MRKFIDGSGADSSAAAWAYLASHDELHLADLYVIKTAPNYAGHYLEKTFYLTDYPTSLRWGYRGTFKGKTSISRGEVSSKIGLESDTLAITWSPKDDDVLALDDSDNVLLSAIGGFGKGVFDNGVVEVWRCVMPTVGDANTLGACLMFSGRIGNVDPDRLKAQISVVSRLEVLNQMVPTNLIEPTNIIAQYTTGQGLAGGPRAFVLVAGSTKRILYADPVDAPGGYTPADATWDFGYVVMADPGKTAGSFAGIRSQIYDGGISHHVFYLYEPLPFDPVAGDAFEAFIPVPRDQAGAATQESDFLAFPNVPVPLNSPVAIL